MTKFTAFIKRNISYISTFLSWILMVWLFWFMEYRLYGGNLDIGFIFILTYPPLFVFLSFIFGDDINEHNQRKSPLRKKIGTGVIIVIIASCTIIILWYIIFKNPYMVRGYQYFLVMIAMGIAYLFPRGRVLLKSNHKIVTTWLLTILFAILIIASLAFCLIVDLVTIPEGREMVAQKGYQNVRFVDNITNNAYLNIVFGGNQSPPTKNEDAMNYYLFLGEKDGEIYGIAVSLVGRRIVGETIAKDNNTLSYYFKDLS